MARPLARLGEYHVPWLHGQAIHPDAFLPVRGTWHWHQYRIRVAPFAGQTWWHCCMMTKVGGQKVFFGGGNFQPSSRWNGTGGFCAMNGSRFREGFVRSDELVFKWQPDMIVCGHGTYYRFAPAHFRKIIRWATTGEAVTAALCPAGRLEHDYYLHSREHD